VQAGALNAVRRSVLLVSLPFFILALVLPVQGKQLGASVLEIGLFFSAFSLMTVLLRPVVGWGLDRVGRRPFFLIGVAGYALTMVGFAFIDRVWGIILARVLQGISSSFAWLAAYAITADVAGEGRRATAFGSVVQASNQGSVIGTFVGLAVLNGVIRLNGQVYYRGQWSHLFIGYGLLSLAALAWALRRLPETRPSSSTTARRPIVWSRPWVLLLLVTLVTGASWAMVSPILIVFLQEELQVGVAELSWAFLPTGLVWALLPARLGRLADRFGRKPLMVLGLAMAAASSFLVPGLGSLVAFAVVWALQALCYAAGDPAEQALVADLIGGDQRGRAFGLYAMAADLGATLGPLAGAWLYQSHGARAPFYANGVVLAVCAAVLGALLRVPPGPRAQQRSAGGLDVQQ
jgi:MFS family permease